MVNDHCFLFKYGSMLDCYGSIARVFSGIQAIIIDHGYALQRWTTCDRFQWLLQNHQTTDRFPNNLSWESV